MGRDHRHGSLRKKVKDKNFPEVFIDVTSDFASIKLSPGVEARSFEKDGFIFCEDSKGRIIEVQVLNLSHLSDKRKKAA